MWAAKQNSAEAGFCVDTKCTGQTLATALGSQLPTLIGILETCFGVLDLVEF